MDWTDTLPVVFNDSRAELAPQSVAQHLQLLAESGCTLPEFRALAGIIQIPNIDDLEPCTASESLSAGKVS